MSRNATIDTARAKVAASSRWDSPNVQTDRRDLRAAKLERDAREAAEALPPLTDEQARRIAAILYPQGVDAR